MKKGITFYIDDDVEMVAFCGALCTKVKDMDKPINGVTMLTLSLEDIKQCSEWYIPVKGKAEPYQPEITVDQKGANE